MIERISRRSGATSEVSPVGASPHLSNPLSSKLAWGDFRTYRSDGKAPRHLWVVVYPTWVQRHVGEAAKGQERGTASDGKEALRVGRRQASCGGMSQIKSRGQRLNI